MVGDDYVDMEFGSGAVKLRLPMIRTTLKSETATTLNAFSS
ncbi:hypothetical protein PO124_23095 [Bacillus licheniformis]|nr:hypothetical protein [Bacillus licheniformis]